MNHLRMMVRMKLSEDIQKVREALRSAKPSDRLTIIAEALMDLNPHGEDAITRASCGSYDWDISMDYRNAEERK